MSDSTRPPDGDTDELLPEYRFDYSKARPNRFAKEGMMIAVTLDPDVAEVFTDAEAVNHALRTLISRVPKAESGVRQEAQE